MKKGLALALLVMLGDQTLKFWMLYIYDIGAKGVVVLTPFLDLILFWGRYGLLPLFAFAAVGLTFWLGKASSSVGAAAIGFIFGGALSNTIDILLYGAVPNFFSIHAFDAVWSFFNIADIAIVVGLVGLITDLIHPH